MDVMFSVVGVIDLREFPLIPSQEDKELWITYHVINELVDDLNEDFIDRLLSIQMNEAL